MLISYVGKASALTVSAVCAFIANCSLGLASGELPFPHFSSVPAPGHYTISNAIVETYFLDHDESRIFNLRLNNQLVTVTSPSAFRTKDLSRFGSGKILSDGYTLTVTEWSTSGVRAYHNGSSPLKITTPPPPRSYPLKMNPNRGFFKFIEVTENSYNLGKMFRPIDPFNKQSSPPFPIRSLYATGSIFSNVTISNTDSVLSGTSFKPAHGFVCLESAHTNQLTGYRSYNGLPVYFDNSNTSFSGHYIFVLCKDY